MLVHQLLGPFDSLVTACLCGASYKQRDDVNFLKHSLAFKTEGDEPRIEYSDVKITTFQPAKRVYGAEAEAAEAARKKAQEAK